MDNKVGTKSKAICENCESAQEITWVEGSYFCGNTEFKLLGKCDMCGEICVVAHKR